MVQPSDRSFFAIVSVDLHGYSRLTEQDELGTHRALMACRHDLLEPAVRDHQGVIVKSTGDGALIRFPNAPAAVEAMIRFQRELASSEATFPESRRLVFRVGIHLAATIHEDGDVYGHGVNLAVRLQEAAEPGSIFMSDAVHRHLEPGSVPSLTRIGRRAFKNIEERVRIHRWRDDAGATVLDRRAAMALTAAVLLAGIIMPTAALDELDPLRHEIDDPGRHLALNRLEPSLKTEGKSPGTLPLEEVPSGREPGPATFPMTAEDWVQPYHGLLAGPLDAGVRTTMAAAERSVESRGEIAEDAYLQALALFGRHTPEAFAQATVELDQALRLKPDHGPSHALLAALHWGGLQNRWQLGRGMTQADMLNRAHGHLADVTAPAPLVHAVTSEMLTANGRHDAAIAEAGRAIALDPTRAVGHYARGRALLFAGRAAEAEEPIRAAIRLDPQASRYLFGLALTQFSMERFDEAERTLARATAQNGEDDWPHLLMAATQGHLGLKAEARQAIGRFDRLSLQRRGWFASQIPYVHSWPFHDDEDRDRLHLGMVLAGIPASTNTGDR